MLWQKGLHHHLGCVSMVSLRWCAVVLWIWGMVLYSTTAQVPNQPMPGQVIGLPNHIDYWKDVNQLELKQSREQLLYPFDPIHDQVHIGATKSLHDQPLTFRLPFFGFAYSYIWVHKDGYAIFNKGLQSYDFPLKFPHIPTRPVDQDPSFIAPWFSQQQVPSLTALPDAGVYVRVVEVEREANLTLRARLMLDFAEGMIGSSDFLPRFAIIVTWKNVTFINRRIDKPLKTNTYQMVLATDEMRTYAMFNYDQITWITHYDNFDGLNGFPAYVGFNAGNSTRAFEFKPYSQHPRIQLLQERGFGNGLSGRFYFQIDEEIWPGSCVEKELDPNWKDRPRLTFFPLHISMLGGTLVNITGPCLFDQRSPIICKFDWREVPGIWQDYNHASCISPPVMFHGYVDLTVSIDHNEFLFLGRLYIQPPGIIESKVHIMGDQDKAEKPNSLTVHWKTEDLSLKPDIPISIHLWGYREQDAYPELSYVATLLEPGSVQSRAEMYSFDLTTTFQEDTIISLDSLDLTFGFISINTTDTRSTRKGVISTSQVIWSGPMPLSWYMTPLLDRKYGKNRWKSHFCEQWFLREKYNDRFALSNFRCPCTMEQAILDRGRFAPDTDCNVIDKKCNILHQDMLHCVTSGRASVAGSGQQCCYDKDGELMHSGDTVYAGRPSRAFIYGKHPYRWQMMVPVLSHWAADVMPFFYCCKWAPGMDNAETCDLFKYWRTSQDCSAYQSAGVASVYGDPHFMTFDGTKYTFNGKGEYVLVHVKNAVHKLDIQGRFEQVPRKMESDPVINATHLTALAMRDNASSIVEIRVRPAAARWRFNMYLLVDKEYVFFWNKPGIKEVQSYKGVTVYQPAGIQNMSHLVVMFDSGAGVEVISDDGHLIAHVYLPITYLKITRGLLGNWSHDPNDDFTLPDGLPITVPGNQPSSYIYDRFGKYWRLKEISEPNLGASLFYHDPIPYSEYDDTGYRPVFGEPPDIPQNFSYAREDINRVCGDSLPCKYDYIVTRDRRFAEYTRRHESLAAALSSALSERVVRCPSLPRPRNGRKVGTTYHPGTTVRFACDDGYRLSGYESRYCRENGLWSWGTDAECIANKDYSRKIGGISVAVILPIVFIIVLILGCFLFRRRKRNSHQTGEHGMTSRAVYEIKGLDRKDDANGEKQPSKNSDV